MNPRLVMKQQPKNFLSRRKRDQEKLNFGFKSTYIGLLTVIWFLLFYYVLSLNTSATLGYDIRELENSQKKLKVELERLNVKMAELDSLDTISSDDIFDTMEAIEDPDYLVIKSWVQYVYNN